MKHYTGICRWNRNTFYTPASKQFEEHIASGAFVRLSVRAGGGGAGRGLLGRATSYMKHYTRICM